MKRILWSLTHAVVLHQTTHGWVVLHLNQSNETCHWPHIKTLPWQTKEAGDSPGWTRAVRNTSFFSLSALGWSEQVEWEESVGVGVKKSKDRAPKGERGGSVNAQNSSSATQETYSCTQDKNLELVLNLDVRVSHHRPVWKAGSKHVLTSQSIFSPIHMNQTSNQHTAQNIQQIRWIIHL